MLKTSLGVSESMDDWVEAVSNAQVRAPAVNPDWSRRQLGLVVIVIALLAPFYGYFVWTQLAKAELRAMEREAVQAAEVVSAQVRAEGIAAAERARKSFESGAAQDLRRRVAAVRVVGAIEGDPAVVIVDRLPIEGAAEAAEVICAQSVHWLRRATGGSTLRVQRDNGKQPATDAGVVVCR